MEMDQQTTQEGMCSNEFGGFTRKRGLNESPKDLKHQRVIVRRASSSTNAV